MLSGARQLNKTASQTHKSITGPAVGGRVRQCDIQFTVYYQSMMQPTAWPGFIVAHSTFTSWQRGHAEFRGPRSPKQSCTFSFECDAHKYTQSQIPWCWQHQLWTVMWNNESKDVVLFRDNINRAVKNLKKFSFLECTETMRCFFYYKVFFKENTPSIT